MKLANRIQKVTASPTLAISTKAAEMRKAGIDVISLAAGEPDFDTPAHICDAAIAAIKHGETKYTAVGGVPALIEAIIQKFKRENNLDYKSNEIIASTGAKQSIYNLLQVILDPLDEVLIPAPYWVSYPDMTKLADAIPVIIPSSSHNHYKIVAADLEQYITPKTKLIMLNSPSNPTGAIYNQQELRDIAAVLLKHPNIYIMSDDIYEHIVFDNNKFYNILNVAAELKDRTIIINGLSKAYAMTGWRLGYAAGPANVIAAMNKLQGQSTSNPCSITQAAGIAALNGPQDFIAEMNVIFKQKQEVAFNKLQQIKGTKCLPIDGAFYAFFETQELIKMLPNINNDIDLAAFWLEKAKVAVVPGSAFGLDNHIRISFALSLEQLSTALDRMISAVNAELS